jgi:hypothetical protein
MDIVQVLQQQLSEAKRQVNAIEKAIAAFGSTLAGNGRGPGRKKRTMSAAARKKIAAAQRARWAKQKAAAKKVKG